MAIRISWTDEMELKLGEILQRETYSAGLRVNGIKMKQYIAITDELRPLARGQPLTADKVQSHVKNLKTKFRWVREVIRASGFGITWDATGKRLTADPVAWADYCKGKDKKLKPMLDKAFILHDILYGILGDQSTGVGATADGDDEEGEEQTPANADADSDKGEDNDQQPNNVEPAVERGQKRGRASSSRVEPEMMKELVGAMKTVGESLVERNRLTALVEEKEEKFGKARAELVDLGLPVEYDDIVDTMLTSNKAYERSFMYKKKEKRVEFVMGLLKRGGHIKD